MSLTFLLAAMLSQAAAPDPAADQLEAFRQHNAAARAARERGDDAAYLVHVRRINALLPDNANVRFAFARALAAAGRGEEAVAQLERLADQGFGYLVREEAAFRSLAESAAFIAVADRLAANASARTGQTPVALPLPDALNGEGIAWSSATASLLLGGRDAIYSRGREAQATERRLAAWSGQILGIRPDPATGTFLACVNDPEKGHAQVVRHAVDDGAILAIYPLPAANALCNDIAILSDGRFVVTDSNNSRLFILRASALVPLPLDRPVIFPNGLAADPASSRLFIAGANGIFVQDLATGSGWEMETSPTTASAIDGLVWHEGSLIGVQNQTTPPRLLRITPDSEARQGRVSVLAADRELLGASTTVAVAENVAYVFSRTTDGGQEKPVLVQVPL